MNFAWTYCARCGDISRRELTYAMWFFCADRATHICSYCWEDWGNSIAIQLYCKYHNDSNEEMAMKIVNMWLNKESLTND